ncbi:MAG: carbon storage regulator [Firmicutes bacterium]|nr:carbon storage regulator [Bacillota bacterium]
MLVLGRRPGEYVMIGDNIKVQVVKSKEGDLRLAIDAPKEMRIIRGELVKEETVGYQ